MSKKHIFMNKLKKKLINILAVKKYIIIKYLSDVLLKKCYIFKTQFFREVDNSIGKIIKRNYAQILYVLKKLFKLSYIQTNINTHIFTVKKF